MESRRRGRFLFFTFILSSYVALLAAYPLLTNSADRSASQGASARSQANDGARDASARKQASSAQGASGAAGDEAPPFEELDRNKDGFLDKSEAGRVPGLSAYFERADRNGDGRLDREEFARGVGIVQGRK